MKLYETTCYEGYEDLGLKNEDYDEYIESLANNYSLKNNWPKIELEIVNKGKKSDMPFFWGEMGMMVISEKFKNEMKDFFCDKSFELLPLYLDETVYYIVHVIEVNKVNFKFEKDNKGNYIRIFSSKELIEKNIVDKGLFRVYLKNGEPDETIFITEKFISMLKNTSLKGFKFKVVWDSEVNDYDNNK